MATSSPFHMKSTVYPVSQILALLLDLQDSLSKIIALQHADERLSGILDTDGLVDLGLEAAVAQPVCDILPVGFGMLGAHVGVADDEADPREALGDGEECVGDGITLLGGEVVLADLAAGDDAPKRVEAVQRALQLLAAHVVVEDVDALAVGQAAQDLRRRPLFRLVVPPAVEPKLLRDELQLVVRAHAAQHRETLVLGELAY